MPRGEIGVGIEIRGELEILKLHRVPHNNADDSTS